MESIKFSLAIEKHDKVSIGRAKGHNTRLHATKSQLPESAWFTKEGRHNVVTWRDDVLAKARGLAKRKDAVVAIEFVLQVGNQTDWRDPPTVDFPEGRPKKPRPVDFKEMVKAAKATAIKEFGAENIVGIDLHTDESSPHIHVVVTPVHEGRLQAKHWLNGKATCGQLRERLHAEFTKFVPCEYTKGEPGGEPHDPERAAGRSKAAKPAPSMIERIAEKMLKLGENAKLRQRVEQLENQVKLAFSQQKSTIRKYTKLIAEQKEKAETAEAFAAASARDADKKVRDLTRKLEDREEKLSAAIAELDDLRPKQQRREHRREVP